MKGGNYHSTTDSEYLDAVETIRRCEVQAGFGYYDGIRVNTTGAALIQKAQRYIDEAEHFHQSVRRKVSTIASKMLFESLTGLTKETKLIGS